MKHYLITYENGNEYFCHCCRQTWKVSETMEFESEEELKTYIDNYNKDWKTNDSRIVTAYELASPTPIF